MADEAVATPLVDLLRRIPPEAMLQWREKDGLQAYCTSPIGKLVHKAADRLASLEEREREREQALSHYAAQYCEGWCQEVGSGGQYGECEGCIARIALSAGVRQNGPEGCSCKSYPHTCHGNKRP